jgi:hypothetical protein
MVIHAVTFWAVDLLLLLMFRCGSSEELEMMKVSDMPVYIFMSSSCDHQVSCLLCQHAQIKTLHDNMHWLVM